jgi:large subunit ribosomal protein L1
MKKGKNYRSVLEKVEKNKVYEVDEALSFVCKNKVAKFDESVEVHASLNIEAKKGDQQVRGAVVLPNGTGKEKKIAVITTTAAAEAKEAGADLIGAEDMILDIKSGKFFEGGYNVLVATPEMMPKLASVAKILGPKGLMPSPKSETVTTKIADTVNMLKKGKVNFKNDATGNIHQMIGKASFGPEKLKVNLESFLEALQKARPSGVKGKFIVNVSICSTMGPGMKIVF